MGTTYQVKAKVDFGGSIKSYVIKVFLNRAYWVALVITTGMIDMQ
jgi:hypothetical protein